MSLDSDYMIDVEFDSENLEFDEDLLDFESVETVSTKERLAKYPEMYNFRPMQRRKQLVGFPEPSNVPGSRDYRRQSVSFLQSPRPMEFDDIEVNIRPGNINFTVICPECGRWFRSANVLLKHKQHHEKGTLDLIKTSFLCPYPECSTQCDCQMTLNEHVRSAHERDDLVYETMQFSNWSEFDRWKEHLEYETTSRYVQTSGRYSSVGKAVRYTCFFSRSTYRSGRAQQGIRQRASRKLEGSCTAFLHARESFGVIHARVCLTHCGHDSHVYNLPLSNAIKREIAAALYKGITEEELLKNFRESCTPSDRRFYIRSYEIRNIHNKMRKSQQTHPEEIYRKRPKIIEQIAEVDHEETV